MKFNKNDKVKFTKKALTNILKYNAIKKMENTGVIVCEGYPYTKVYFSSINKTWWIDNKALELIVKNQQLLFNFMEIVI